MHFGVSGRLHRLSGDKKFMVDLNFLDIDKAKEYSAGLVGRGDLSKLLHVKYVLNRKRVSKACAVWRGLFAFALSII
jgi:hypothetical protein